MIIQVRGTSGSGKTTVVRNVMDLVYSWQAEYIEGRKQPLYYRSVEVEGIAVVGHYERPCGGGDTIGSAAQCSAQILKLKDAGFKVVLCEGLLLSEDFKWTVQMPDVRVVYMTTSPELCVERVKGRRLEAGNTRPLNTANTLGRVKVIERSRLKLTEAGVKCYRMSPDQAPKVIFKWIQEALNA